VNESCVATLTASNVENLSIELGQEWTEELELEITNIQSSDKTRAIALQLLSRRSWAKRELTNRLVKRGCDSKDATSVANQLEEEGWLDDLAYAGALIREWLRAEPASRLWLQRKLSEKGISSDDCEKAINEELGDQSEQDAATELAIIRIGKVTSTDEATVRRRVIAAIQRRGFCSVVASEAYSRAT
jgi:SOS response regulatory protein OraA/RecX